MKVAQYILAPHGDLHQYNDYVNQKMEIEERLVKFPFKDLIASDILNYKKRKFA